MQLVFARALARRHGLELVLTDTLLHSRSRRYRGLTQRSISPLLAEWLPIGRSPWHRFVLARCAARLHWLSPGSILTDQRFFVEAQHASSLLDRLGSIRVIHSHATHPCVFGDDFNAEWDLVLTRLDLYSPKSRPHIVVHVRRTDYLNPRSGFLPLGSTYYRQALTKALALLPVSQSKPRVFVCTDDPAWCSKHLTDLNWQLHLTHGSPEQDLAAMICPDVLITSNSSLSAIAGHLSQLRNPLHHILTPARWLRNPVNQLGDLRKPQWQVVDV